MTETAITDTRSSATRFAAQMPRSLPGYILLFAILAGTVLYPMYWLAIGSFRTEWGDWTLEHYREVFTPFYLQVMANTMLYAAATVAIAVPLGGSLAWLVARTDMPGRGVVKALVTITFVMPPLFHALAFVFLFQPQAGIVNNLLEPVIGLRPFNIFSFEGMVIATAFGLFPQAFLLIEAALRGVDPSLEEAASASGASQLRILRTVVLPLVTPAILTSVVLGLIEVLAVFGPPAVIGVPAKIFVMSSQVYIELTSAPPRIEFSAALAVLFLQIAILLLVLQEVLLRRRSYVTIIGKGFRPRLTRLRGWRWCAIGYCTLIVLIGLVIPTLILMLVSVSKVWAGGLSFDNFTLQYYLEAIRGDARAATGLTNTLLLAFATLAATLAVGLPVAWIVTRQRGLGAKVLRFVAFLPFSIPAVIFTVGVILAFINPPVVLYGTLAIILVCYFGRFLPLAVQPLSDSLRQIDGSLEEAARVVGSGSVRTMIWIVMPLLKFAVFSTSVMIFVACVREIVSIALLYSPGTETLMMTAMIYWEEGQIQLTAAIVVFILFAVAVFYGISRLVGSRSGIRG